MSIIDMEVFDEILVYKHRTDRKIKPTSETFESIVTLTRFIEIYLLYS